MGAVPPFPPPPLFLGDSVIPLPWESVPAGTSQSVPIIVLRLGGSLFMGLVSDLVFLFLYAEMLVDKVTSHLLFVVKGCTWCKSVEIRIGDRETGSWDSQYSIAASGYSGYTLDI